MKRKIYDELLAWKNEDVRNCALMIDGARRIGKSYVTEEFAKNESYILIDFNITRKKVRDLFDFYLNNLDVFFWLKDSGVMTPCYNTTEPSLGVKDEQRTYHNEVFYGSHRFINKPRFLLPKLTYHFVSGMYA